MNPKISIIYSTNRVDPKFDWFVLSLDNQINDSDKDAVEIILVNYTCKFYMDNEPLDKFEINGFNVIKSSPKPNIYQGQQRKTTGEYFSPANARNTGALLSSGEYLVFVDDVSILMPGWFDEVKKAASENKIVCGAYQKHFEMVVENGNLISSRKHDAGIDSRWGLGEYAKITGQQLFGCSFGIPAKDFIEVNGFDEICDSIGGEDYQLGIRLNNAGKEIFYNRKMLTIESEELHNQPYLMKREDRVLSPDEYMKKLISFGVHKRHRQGNWDSSHMILDILYGTKQIKSIGNNYSIEADRPSKYFVPVPDTEVHWFDGKLLSEML